MTEPIAPAERAEILDLLTRYCRRIDDGRYDLIPGMFTEGATFAAMGQQVQGRDAIAAFFPTGADPGSGPSTTHLLANVVLDRASASQVNAVSDFVVLGRAADGSYGVVMAGRYTDVVELAAGQWRLASRRTSALKRAG